MTRLVTGSSGHLGEALVRTLRERGDRVRGLDIKDGMATDHVGSITNRRFVEVLMQGVDTVFHAATLHKPHAATHSKQDFIDANVSGTLVLLEAAVAAGVGKFIFTSTTSAYGDALRPPPDEPAAWITEAVVPVPKNIYGATKLAAENLCQIFHRNHGLDVLVLRTSRFFPEEDDDAQRRMGWSADNSKANELLFRRADIADMVSAHLAAADVPRTDDFRRYIISATSPFARSDLTELRNDAPAVLKRYFPAYEAVYADLGWSMFPGIDRVYVNDAARQALGWEPEYTFARLLNCLAAGEDPRSPLARSIGSKGYHDEVFEDGPFPVE